MFSLKFSCVFKSIPYIKLSSIKEQQLIHRMLSRGGDRKHSSEVFKILLQRQQPIFLDQILVKCTTN